MKSFFLPYSIGTDICHVPRIQRLLSPSSGRRRPQPASFIRRLLTSREQTAYRTRLDGVEPPKSVARFLAGRWAAKEAIVKAYTWRRLTFGEIEILPAGDRGGEEVERSGARAPRAIVRAAIGDRDGMGRVVDSDEDVEVKISISHDGEYAIAMCMAAVEDGENGTAGEGSGDSARAGR